MVVIGLDGCEWELINPWIKDGLLPTFEKIVSNGLHCNMVSTVPPVTAPALTSFITGRDPGNTGITGFIKADGGLISSADIRDPAIWDYLGQAGLRSLIVGLRVTYPPKIIDGVMISGGLLRAEGRNYVEPQELQNICGGYQPDKVNYPVLHKALQRGVVKNHKQFTDEIIKLTRKQFSIFRELQKTEDFPFSLFYLENTDLIQHFVWHKPDEILRLYKCVDELLQQFLDENPGANLMIMSDHGFHATPDKDFHINTWLAKLGYLKPGKGIFGPSNLHKMKKRLVAAIPVMTKRRLRLLYGKLRRPVPDNVMGEQGAVPVSPPPYVSAPKLGIDPESVIAFGSIGWGVKLDLKLPNREEIRSKLILEMKALLDDDGRKVFKLVHPVEEIYAGKFREIMPDILYLTSDKYNVNLQVSDKVFRPTLMRSHTTGSHNTAYFGVMVGYGPSLDSSQQLNEIRITDFLPTILDYFAVPVPESVDGASLARIFGVGAQARVKSDITMNSDTNEKPDYTEEDKAKIMEKLHHLGYM